jgi:hypothetical protein
MAVRPEYEPTVPLNLEELAAFIARVRTYAEASSLDAGLYQVLIRSASWLERARPLLERQGRPWWGRNRR